MDKKTLEIKKYFNRRRDEYNSWAKHHNHMASKAPEMSAEKRYHEDNSWRFGVIMPTVMRDIEKDILKIIGA